MKYKEEIFIQKPVAQLISLFDKEENLYPWQEGLKKVEHLSSEKGEIEAKMKIIFKMRKRDFEMIERITKKNVNNLLNPDKSSFAL